ncbi:MAG TPA: methyltransferase domain-containing protein [Xanthobacteraceae bacterium]|jgi:predicted methyltransferase|nr:methyltransferase domain-containing protein [Xanthobacteraceae bacterium]
MKRMIGVAATAAALAVVSLPAAMLTAHAQSTTAQSTTPAPDYQAILAAPDRSDADRANDKKRHAAELLAFTGAKPGMTVLDMGAGGGYSTELLARAVAPNGKVYGQDAAGGSARAQAAFDKRTQTPAMKNVVRDLRPYDDPIPDGVKNLDLITFFFAYHDTTYMPVDRKAMDKKMFDALKPGGILVVADHAAKDGDGASVGKTLHRIEEKTLRGEIEAAGFQFVAEGRFLHNPDDPHDKPVFRLPIPVDEFVLKFKKP